jgi:hypothetical protein
MTVITRPGSPVRLVGLFAFSVLVFGLLASAAGAAMYVVDTERGRGTDAVAPAANVELPSGLVLVSQVDEQVWRDKVGFAPFLPDIMPAGVDPTPRLYVQQPDDHSRVAGHVRYAPAGGPAVVLIEQQGTLSREVGMRTQDSDSARSHIETFVCGTIVIQAQVYFSLESDAAPTAGETGLIAADFVNALRAQCDE